MLLSSGAATFWQVSTLEFETLLKQSSSDLACQALAQLALSRVPLVNATKALEEQLLELAAINEATPHDSSSTDSGKLFKVCRDKTAPAHESRLIAGRSIVMCYTGYPLTAAPR